MNCYELSELANTQEYQRAKCLTKRPHHKLLENTKKITKDHYIFPEKKLCWELLREAPSGMHLENIIRAGDLNVVLNPSEKRGDSMTRDPI
jgi:hypothetical protein